jgi:hypothetical protein
MKRFFLSGLTVLLLAGPASAASCYVSEFSQAGDAAVQVARQPALVDQTPVAVGATSAQSAAFNANTKLVRIECDVVASMAFGANPTATSSNARISAGAPEYFQVTPGSKVAFITNN